MAENETTSKQSNDEKFIEVASLPPSQYGHSQSEKKLWLGDKYHHSIKVHTLEAQNQHELKYPLSDPNFFFLLYNT